MSIPYTTFINVQVETEFVFKEINGGALYTHGQIRTANGDFFWVCAMDDVAQRIKEAEFKKKDVIPLFLAWTTRYQKKLTNGLNIREVSFKIFNIDVGQRKKTIEKNTDALTSLPPIEDLDAFRD